MWKRLIRYQLRRPLGTHYSTNRSYVERTRKYLNDNPYFIVSLGFVGVVLVFGVIVDWITRKNKLTANLYQCLPPCPCHSVISLYSPLLDNKHISLTGPEGCGKTTLTFTTSQLFLRQRSLWHRKEPRVFYVDGSDKQSLMNSLRECLLSYGLTGDDIKARGKSSHDVSAGGIDEELELMTSSLKKKLSSNSRWLLTIDNINDNTISSVTLLATSFINGRIIVVSHDPSVADSLEQSIPSMHHVSINR